MSINERESSIPVQEVSRRVEDGVEYVTLVPTRTRDRVFDQVAGRVLGWAGAGAGFVIGAVLEKMEARSRRVRRESHITTF